MAPHLLASSSTASTFTLCSSYIVTKQQPSATDPMTDQKLVYPQPCSLTPLAG